jgi:hypothetical protein
MSVLWVLFPFALFFAGLFFVVLVRRKACPDCNEPLSPIQSPFTKTWRQWVEGGYVCQNCGCKVDIAGTKVPAGTAPQKRSIITGIGLLALAVIPAIVLLTLLIRR